MQSSEEVGDRVNKTEEEGTAGTLVAGESASADGTADKTEEAQEGNSSTYSPQHQKQSPGTSVEKSPIVTSPTPSLPYTEPHWSGVPSLRYFLTVIKSGSVMQEVDISNKPFQV